MGYNKRTGGNENGFAALDEPEPRRQIRARYRALMANFGRRTIAEMELTWVNKLEEFAGAKLYAAMDKALEEEKMPTLGRILEMFRGRRDTEQWTPPPPLTDEQRKRSDTAAIMSMLWFRYNFEEATNAELGFDVLHRCFGKDPTKALAAAKELYPKEVANMWMQDQQRAGN